MAFDVATAYDNDYTYFDGYEQVTLTPQNPAETAVEDVPALQYPVDQSQIGSGDFSSEDYDATFHLWDVGLFSYVVDQAGNYVLTDSGQRIKTGATAPKNGDKLTDAASVDWTIIAAVRRGFEPQWELRCRQQK